MSGLVMCQGKKAQIPYYIEGIGKHVHTVEELCFFLWQYVHLLEPSFINQTLIDWIGKQLGLEELARLMGQKVQANADMAELVFCIMEHVCYLESGELEEYKERLKQAQDMSVFERRKCKADDLVRSQKYYKALAEYQKLLDEEEAQDKETAGRIYHNMGVAFSRMFFFKESCDCFLKAFLASPDKERMRQYKLAVRLCKDEIEEDELVREFPSASSMDMQVYEELEAARKAESAKSQKIARLRELKEEGKIAGYYKEIEETLREWNDECREYMQP